MGNGRFDVCSAPAAYRAKVIENGLRKTRELCDDHYQKLLHRAGGRSGCGFRSPLESMFGGSLFDTFLVAEILSTVLLVMSHRISPTVHTKILVTASL